MDVFEGLIAETGTKYYSRPMPTNGLRGVRLVLKVLSATAANDVTAVVEESDTLDNWTTVVVSTVVSAFPGINSHSTGSFSEATTARYIRAVVEVTGTGGRAYVTASLYTYQFEG